MMNVKLYLCFVSGHDDSFLSGYYWSWTVIVVIAHIIRDILLF